MARHVAALALAIASLTLMPASGLAAVLGGDQTVERTVDQNLAGNAEAIQLTAGASGTAGTVSVYVDSTSSASTLVAGLYADNGGHPGALLTQGSKTAPAAGAWADVSVPPVSILSGAKYWIGILSPSGTLKFRIKSGGKAESPTATGLSSLPATWTTRSSYADTASAYLQSATVTGPVLAAAPLSLAFTAQAGGTQAPAQTVSVTNAGTGALTYSSASDAAWLTATPASGAAPATLTVSANLDGLSPGAYTGHVTVTGAPPATGQAQVVAVTFNVAAPSSPGGPSDWLTIDHDPGRSGEAAAESTLGTANASQLGLLWSTGLDGKITAQPLYVSQVSAGGQVRNLLVAATHQNSLYGVDADTGVIVWQRNFGTPPSNVAIPGGYGIGAAPVIDRAAGRIYAITDNGSLVTVSLANGADAAPPLALIDRPTTNRVWGGLNLSAGNLYVSTASDGGDTPPWRGQVYRLVTGPSTPTLLNTWTVVPGLPAPTGGGGIWGYGGVSVDSATGHVYAATAADSNELYTLYGNRIVGLDAGLGVLGSYLPSEPGTFPCSGDPCDLDFGSTPLVFKPSGCGTMVVAGNKNGNLYVMRTSDLEANGQPLQILPLNATNDWLGSGGVGGVPAYWAAGRMVYIGDAGSGLPGISAGIVALTVRQDCTLQVVWSQPIGGNTQPNSTPTVANGVVYIGEGNGGRVHAYNALTGAPLWDSGANAAGATYAAPIVADGKLFAGSWDGFGVGNHGTLRAFAPGAGTGGGGGGGGAGATLLGNTATEQQRDFVATGRAEAFQVTATAAGNLANLSVYVDTSTTSAKIVVGLYADASGHPGALLAQATKLAPTSGAWATVSIPATAVVSGGKYWLAVTGGNVGTLRFRDRFKGPCKSELAAQTALDTLPATWTSSSVYSDCPLSGYGTAAP
jgi:outer membrane protein assembly factor BamB